MGNLLTSQRLTKGLNELTNMLIIFMVSIRKITGLHLPDVRKSSLKTTYDLIVIWSNYTL